MSLERFRLRLTVAYAGIFALTIVLVGVVAVFGFWAELVSQQDDPLRQEAKSQAQIVLNPHNRQDLARGSSEFGWVALRPDGRVIERESTSRSLGLPSRDLFRKTLRENAASFRTIHGPKGYARVVSMPMHKGGRVVGVIQYARSLDQARATVRKLVLVLLPLSLGALGVAAAGGAFVAGRAMRPVQDSFERQKTFIANASHKLKTPLTVVRATAEVLQRRLGSSGDTRLTNKLLTETDKMSSMISELLLVARLDAGKASTAEKTFDLPAVILESADRFERRAGSENMHLEVKVPEKLPVRGDPRYTEQILDVLLDNVLQHVPRPGNVTLSARPQGHFVEVEVRDSGPGIPVRDRELIFERFYQAKPGASGKDGTAAGLGLSITLDLARAQRGDLTAENGEEGEAVFHLRLPKV